MAAATADVSAGADPEVAPVRRGKKKIIVVGAAVLAVVLALGAGTTVWLKQRAARAAAAAEDDPIEQAHKIDAKGAPLYMPLEPFVVNLADREADRYAQIGITFELDSGVSADQIRAYMPAIRNAILMIIAHKTSRELLDRTGKEQLADEITRGALRPMGIEAAPPATIPAIPAIAAIAPAASDAASGAASAAVAKRRTDARRPIQHVHFSSFIIQ